MVAKLIKSEILLSNEIETDRLQLSRPAKKDFILLANLWRNKKARIFLGGVVSETQEANSASCRILEKVGMACIDRFKQFGENQCMYVLKKLGWEIMKVSSSH